MSGVTPPGVTYTAQCHHRPKCGWSVTSNVPDELEAYWLAHLAWHAALQVETTQ